MKNSYILIIYKFQNLFNILNEIKSNLNFDIKKVNDEKIKDNINQKNVLIISNKKITDTKNTVNVEKYPINIQKLIEIINIQFLKNKFSHQNNIKVGKYFINLNSRKMSYKNNHLPLTEKEIKIINFLNSLSKAATINSLQSEVWGYKSKLETHTVETHVYRLRKKVEKKFNDKSFIISIENGYKIEK